MNEEHVGRWAKKGNVSHYEKQVINSCEKGLAKHIG